MLTYSTKKHGYALALAPKRFSLTLALPKLDSSLPGPVDTEAPCSRTAMKRSREAADFAKLEALVLSAVHTRHPGVVPFYHQARTVGIRKHIG